MTECMTEMIKSVNDSLKQMIPTSTQNAIKQIQETHEEMVKQFGQNLKHISQQSKPRMLEKNDDENVSDEN